MNKIIAAIALIFGIGLAFTAIPEIAQADPHYYVVRDGGPHSDGYVEIRSKAHGQGDVLCKVPASNYLNRRHEQNWSRWIWVEWQIPTPSHITNPNGGSSYYGHEEDSRSAVEWNFVGTDGSWCNAFIGNGRAGWVDKADPDLRVLNGHPNDRFGVVRVPNTWGLRVSAPEDYLNEGVPVYRTTSEYFNYRDNGIIGNPVCRIQAGEKVDWHKHVKDWGVTQVRFNRCLGYMDRGALR